ncbi:hypothetical protein FKM82_018420, partial [Ascaphus truei]
AGGNEGYVWWGVKPHLIYLQASLLLDPVSLGPRGRDRAGGKTLSPCESLRCRERRARESKKSAEQRLSHTSEYPGPVLLPTCKSCASSCYVCMGSLLIRTRLDRSSFRM